MKTVTIDVGPAHPGIHGTISLVVELDGEIVRSVEPHIGSLHRGVEKLLENRLYMQSPSYVERLDYIAPLSWDDLFVSAVEKATNTKVRERAQWARMVLLEFQRIASHFMWLGTFCNDMELSTAVSWSFADRQKVLGFLEYIAKSRVFYLNLRLGGLERNLPIDFKKEGLRLADYLEDRVHDYRRLLEDDPIFLERTRNIGVLKSPDAIDMGVCGPVLRGSGIAEDVRKSKPYYFYDKVKFTVPVQTRSDCLGRYRIRIEEIGESVKIIKQALDAMPQTGEVKGHNIDLSGPNASPDSILISRELPRGEGLIYMVPGKQRPNRVSLKSPSFSNLAALSKICKDVKLSDVPTILGSLDIVVSEIDK